MHLFKNVFEVTVNCRISECEACLLISSVLTKLLQGCSQKSREFLKLTSITLLHIFQLEGVVLHYHTPFKYIHKRTNIHLYLYTDTYAFFIDWSWTFVRGDLVKQRVFWRILTIHFSESVFLCILYIPWRKTGTSIKQESQDRPLEGIEYLTAQVTQMLLSKLLSLPFASHSRYLPEHTSSTLLTSQGYLGSQFLCGGGTQTVHVASAIPQAVSVFHRVFFFESCWSIQANRNYVFVTSSLIALGWLQDSSSFFQAVLSSQDMLLPMPTLLCIIFVWSKLLLLLLKLCYLIHVKNMCFFNILRNKCMLGLC